MAGRGDGQRMPGTGQEVEGVVQDKAGEEGEKGGCGEAACEAARGGRVLPALATPALGGSPASTPVVPVLGSFDQQGALELVLDRGHERVGRMIAAEFGATPTRIVRRKEQRVGRCRTGGPQCPVARGASTVPL
jgi:hypothetical protein